MGGTGAPFDESYLFFLVLQNVSTLIRSKLLWKTKIVLSRANARPHHSWVQMKQYPSVVVSSLCFLSAPMYGPCEKQQVVLPRVSYVCRTPAPPRLPCQQPLRDNPVINEEPSVPHVPWGSRRGRFRRMLSFSSEAANQDASRRPFSPSCPTYLLSSIEYSSDAGI